MSLTAVTRIGWNRSKKVCKPACLVGEKNGGRQHLQRFVQNDHSNNRNERRETTRRMSRLFISCRQWYDVVEVCHCGHLSWTEHWHHTDFAVDEYCVRGVAKRNAMKDRSCRVIANALLVPDIVARRNPFRIRQDVAPAIELPHLSRNEVNVSVSIVRIFDVLLGSWLACARRIGWSMAVIGWSRNSSLGRPVR